MPSHERDVYERKARVIKRRMEEQESQQKARLQEQEKMMQHHGEMMSHHPGDPHHHHHPHQHPVATGGQVQIQGGQHGGPPGVHHPNTPGPTMQFYQTATPGQPGTATVIQMMHTNSPATNVSTNAANMQPRPGMMEQGLVLTNQMPHAPVLATTGGQQVGRKIIVFNLSPIYLNGDRETILSYVGEMGVISDGFWVRLVFGYF